jgi:hypothetical protein
VKKVGAKLYQKFKMTILPLIITLTNSVSTGRGLGRVGMVWEDGRQEAQGGGNQLRE